MKRILSAVVIALTLAITTPTYAQSPWSGGTNGFYNCITIDWVEACYWVSLPDYTQDWLYQLGIGSLDFGLDWWLWFINGGFSTIPWF